MQDIKNTQLESLTEESKLLHLSPFWTEVKNLEVDEPTASAAPYVWSFAQVKALLDVACDVVPLEMAERRAVVFRNPAYKSRIATTPNLYAAYSQYNHGERANAHRHTANAVRIGLHGTGGYTTVEGTKYLLNRGDLVLTPNWTWHDHGNDGAEPNTWFDILDVPLMVHLNSLFFDFKLYEKTDSGNTVQRPVQTPKTVESANAISDLYNGISDGSFATLARRKYFFPWPATRSSLLAKKKRVCENAGENECSVRLTDPRNGGPLLQTIDISVHLLCAGKATQPTRISCSTVILVMEGEGYSEIGGKRFNWTENDVICVPNWTWVRHVSTDADKDVLFYSMTDAPVYGFTESLRVEISS